MIDEIIARTKTTGWNGKLDNRDRKGSTFTIQLRTKALPGPTQRKPIGLLGISTPVIASIAFDQKVQSIIEQLNTLDAYAAPPNATEDSIPLNLPELTHREQEILTLIGRGLSSGEICHRLGISTNTLQTHKRNLREKLNLPNAPALQHFATHWTDAHQS